MRIYRGKIEPACQEILDRLLAEGLVEISGEMNEEARKDLESVLSEYSRMEREISEAAKDQAQKKGLDYGSVGRLRRSLAKERAFGIDDEAIDYPVQQMIEIMMSTPHVDEVFAQDHELNRAIVPILRKHMAAEEELDKEVRKKLKHLEDAEGTVSWEIEYQRKKEELERLKRLT